MVYHFMSDDDVDRIMKHPYVGVRVRQRVLTLGDGVPHPRGYGNNARMLGEYVRVRHVISLEEAIRKMTSLPARTLPLRRPRSDQGRLRRRHRPLRCQHGRRHRNVREAARLCDRHPLCAGQRSSGGEERRAHRRETGALLRRSDGGPANARNQSSAQRSVITRTIEADDARTTRRAATAAMPMGAQRVDRWRPPMTASVAP